MRALYGFGAKNMWEMLETSLVDFQIVCFIKPWLDSEFGKTDPFNLELHIEGLESLYLEKLYPELAAAKANETADAEELAAAEAQVAGVVSAIVEELRMQAESIAAGVVSDAKDYSERYVARIAACENQEELIVAIAEINAEMGDVPLFSNTTSIFSGTPYALYNEQYITEYPKFTLAGALLNWYFDIANQQ